VLHKAGNYALSATIFLRNSAFASEKTQYFNTGRTITSFLMRQIAASIILQKIVSSYLICLTFNKSSLMRYSRFVVRWGIKETMTSFWNIYSITFRKLTKRQNAQRFKGVRINYSDHSGPFHTTWPDCCTVAIDRTSYCSTAKCKRKHCQRM